MQSSLVSGVIAGAVGTVALNAVTYLDMALRARPASEMPAKAAGKMADQAGVDLGDEDAASQRTEALGALMGFATGIGVGAAYGLVRSVVRVPVPVAAVALGAAAMVGSDAPLTAMGLTDPREWPASSWASDIVPHVAYGLVTAATYEAVLR